MRSVICDKCGAWLKEYSFVGYGGRCKTEPGEPPEPLPAFGRDLCPDCYAELKEWVQLWLHQPRQDQL